MFCCNNKFSFVEKLDNVVCSTLNCGMLVRGACQTLQRNIGVYFMSAIPSLFSLSNSVKDLLCLLMLVVMPSVNFSASTAVPV